MKFAERGKIPIPQPSLSPIIQKVMGEESWISLFAEKSKKIRKPATNQDEFFAKLTKILQDTDLTKSEDAYRARIFLIASVARNLTVHTYATDDWFYGELFGEMLHATVYATLYSWQKARREGWA